MPKPRKEALMIDTETTWAQKVAALAAELGHAPGLDELLPMARLHKMTPAEQEAQRQSYARGEAAFGSDADEAAFRAALMSGDTAEIARLQREADARVMAVTQAALLA